MRIRGAIALAALVPAACAPAPGDAPRCAEPGRTGVLPAELGESSGVAASRRHAGVFWTHNDSGGGSVLFAIDSAGRVLGRVRVRGARNVDWEDIALGSCPAGDCLYIADTGDNRLRRGDAAVYRIPEPAPGDTATVAAERFPVRYPDSPHDAEALYVLPGDQLFLVTKGHHAAITVFRYPGRLRAGETVELVAVQALSEAPVGLPYQVTGAAAAPDGRWVAIRTYTAVQLYAVRSRGRLTAVLPPPGVDLQALAEPQGEAVGIAPDWSIRLTSEAGPSDVPGVVARLACAAARGSTDATGR